MADNGDEDSVDVPAKVRALFKQLDTDGSGYIESAELDELLEMLGVEAEERAQKVPVLLQQMDADGDGQITLEEFAKCAYDLGLIESDQTKLDGLSAQERELAEKAWQIFDDIDEDGSGTIDIGELEIVLSELGVDDAFTRRTKAKELMQELDEDGSGEIDREEFDHAITSGKFNFVVMQNGSAFGGDFQAKMDASGTVRYGKEEEWVRKGMFDEEDEAEKVPRASIIVTDEEPRTPPRGRIDDDDLRLPDARNVRSPAAARRLLTPTLNRRRQSNAAAARRGSKGPAQPQGPQTEEEKEQFLKDIFELADTDGSGEINIRELYDVLQDPEIAHGHSLSKDQLQAIMAEIDDSGDNELDFKEFKDAFGHLFLDDPSKPDIMHVMKQQLEVEKQQLEHKVAQLESEKRELRASYDKRLADMEKAMQETQDISNQENEALTFKNTDLTRRNKDLTAKLHTLNDELEDLERRLALQERNGRPSDIQFGQINLGDDGDIVDKTTELRMVRAELQEWINKHDILAQALIDLREEFFQRETTYKQTIETYKLSMSGSAADQIEFLQQQVADLTKENENLKSREPIILSNNIPTTSQVPEDYDSSATVTESVREVVFEVDEPREAASVSLERFNEVVHGYETELNKLKRELAVAQAESQEYEEEVHRLNTLLASRASSAQLSVEEHKELEMLRAGVSGWRSERDALQAQVEMYKKAAEQQPDYRAELEAKYKGKEADLKQQLKRAQRQVQDVQTEYDQLHSRSVQMETELKRLREKLDDGLDDEEQERRQQERLFEAQEELRKVKVSLQINIRELDDTKFDLATAKHKIGQLQAENEALRQESDADLKRLRERYSKSLDDLFDTIVERERMINLEVDENPSRDDHDAALRERLKALSEAWEGRERAFLSEIERLKVQALEGGAGIGPDPRVGRLEEELQAALEKIRRLQSAQQPDETEDLEDATSETREREAQLMMEISRMQDEEEANERAIAERIAAMGEHLRDLEQENAKLKALYESEKQCTAELKAKLDEAQATLDQLRAQYNALKQQGTGTGDDSGLHDALERTITKMRTMELEFDVERNQLRKRADDAEAQLQSLLTPGSHSGVEVAQLESRLRQAAITNEELQAEVNRLAAALAAAPSEPSDVAQEYGRLKASLDLLQREKEDLQRSLEEVARTREIVVTAETSPNVDRLQLEIAQLKEENARLSMAQGDGPFVAAPFSAPPNAERDYFALEDELDAAKAENARLQRALEKLEADKARWSDAQETAAQREIVVTVEVPPKVEELETEVVRLREYTATLEEEKQILSDRLQSRPAPQQGRPFGFDSSRELARVEAHNIELQRQLERAQNELKAARAQQAGSGFAPNASTSTDVVEVPVWIQRIQSDVARLVEENAELRARLAQSSGTAQPPARVSQQQLNSSIGTLTEQVQRLEKQVQTLIVEKKVLVQQVQTLQSPSASVSFSDDPSRLREQLTKVLAENAVLKARLAELEGRAETLAEYRAQIAELNAQLSRHHQSSFISETTRSEITVIQERTAKLEAALLAAQAERDAAIKTKLFIEEESDKIRHQLTQENGTLRAQLAAAQEAQVYANRTIKSQADELQRLTRELTKFSHERTMNRTTLLETRNETLHELSEIRAMTQEVAARRAETNRSLVDLAVSASRIQERPEEQKPQAQSQLQTRPVPADTSRSQYSTSLYERHVEKRTVTHSQRGGQTSVLQQSHSSSVQQPRQPQVTQSANTSVAVQPARTRHVPLQGWGERSHISPATSSGPRGAFYFPVTVWDSDYSKKLGLRGPVWLRVSFDGIAALHQDKWTVLRTWPLSHIKRYGRDDGVFSFEVGDISPLGTGVMYFATVHMDEVFDAVRARVNRSAVSPRR